MQQRVAPKPGQLIQREGGAIEAVQPGYRSATFVISDEIADRYGDVIEAKGWSFEHFRNNPVVLWGHQSRELPIGKVRDGRVWQEGTKSLATVDFVSADVNPFAESVWKLVDRGVLRACSVGFRSTAEPEYIRDDKGAWTGSFRFTSQELLELSMVSVPALPTALAVAKALDVPGASLRRIFGDREGASAHARRQSDLRTLSIRGMT